MPPTKLSKGGSTMHAAGIFADKTVDGPEIGTLVVIVDRAKNLPNRKSMGKQDPYCNCRLAKEAKKTKTDKRGGQVPKWDEELRFTVRDSADYYQLKVSIFNDDKKTELIGEAWVDISDVVKPGGGQSDIWHNLNCKGKYAGEVRLEMTYYDSRPKPEKTAEEVLMDSTREASGSHGGSKHQTPVKRRPLPAGPGGDSPAEQLRAGGPRELGTSSRPLPQPAGRSAGNTPSSSRRTVHNNNQPQPVERRPVSQQNFYPETPDDVFVQDSAHTVHPQPNAYDQFGGFEPNPPPPQTQHQDYQYQDNPMTGLPELPPMTNNRRQGSNHPSQQDQYRNDYNQPTPPRHPELHHAHSAPQVSTTAPYPEDMMHPRDTIQHTQSDNYMIQGQPARHEYEDPYQQPRDPYPPTQQHHHEIERRSSYGYQEPPQQPPQRSPVHEGYDHVPLNSMYRRPSDQYECPSSSHYQLDAPPPPPAHRDSTPNSSRHDPYANYAPAPLNITPVRRSPSPLPFPEHDSYAVAQQYGTPEYGGRRNTAPVDSSPQEPHIYRPRARSGEAMRDANRPPSRDSRAEEYMLPPSHPDYYSPTTGTAPDFPETRHTPAHRRDSYQPPYQPATRSPLAVESPHSFRDDRSSLPSQANTPLRGSDSYQPSPATRAITASNRPYSNHHYSSSEPYVPQTSYQTPPRQHPLAQQVPTGSSPNSYIQPTPPQDGGVPIVKPIAISPVHTPGSERYSRATSRLTPTTRKSVSPHHPPSSSSSIRPQRSSHFDPSSFNRFNPAALSSTSSLVNHPATSSSGSTPAKSDSPLPMTKDGKIVDFHGNHIDPSDRLPETSWAPEPEPKVPMPTKPAREREGLVGARDLNVTLVPRGEGSPSAGAGAVTSGGGGGVIRARLRKKERPSSAIIMANPSTIHDRPFRDIPNPAGPPPLETSHSYSSPSQNYSPSHAHSPSYGFGSDVSPSGGHRHSFYGGNGNGPPPIPAKVPLVGMYSRGGGEEEGMSALQREIGGIDLGPAPMGGQRVARGRMLGFRS